MNGNEGPRSEGFRITPRLIVGLGILTLGILWTLDNFAIIDFDRVVDFWPLIMIFAGIARLFDPRKGKVGTTILITLGILLLLSNLDLIYLRMRDVIPLAIVLLGGKIAWDALRGRQIQASATDPSAVFHAFAMMGGAKREIVSNEFRGGDANAIMGGVEIDLTNAKIKEGEQAIIDAFVLWGGVEITVPDEWRVDGQVLPLLGGFEVKNRTKDPSAPTVIVRGAAVMGAVVVKHASDPRRS